METLATEASVPLTTRLRGAVRGEVIGPADTAYEQARTMFYTGIDRRPAAIVRPVDAPDVARAIGFARENGLELAVRSGGHSVAGYAMVDDGLVIDLAALRDISVDVASRAAWAGTGLTAGEYTAAVGAHGLATGFGDAHSVGLGGITLGGGIGFLHRKYGLTIDSLLAAEIVTADGEVLLADESSHPDLFWAIRGGGGNFGVATGFRFRLHEVDRVYGGFLILPVTPDRIARLISLADEAPEELSGMINVMVAPPLPVFPPDLHGKLIAMVALVYAGDPESGERALAPIRALATPVADTFGPIRYPQVYEGPEPPRPSLISVRSLYADSLDVGTAEALVDHLHRSTAAMSVAQFRVLGGAVARVAPDATAFAHRTRGMLVAVAAAYMNPDQRAEQDAWTADMVAVLSQGPAGAYPGFLSDGSDARVHEAYPGPTLERLRQVKGKYDPENVFRRNLNVRP